MKARQKCPVAELTTGCSSKKDTCIEEKRGFGKEAVRYTRKTNKKRTKMYTDTQVCMLVCMIVGVPRANLS
jgi:hypothetical protein